MRNRLGRKLLGFALSLTLVGWLLTASALGAAIEINLVAENATVTMPDSSVIPMWGFRDTADANHPAGAWRIPTITAMAGDSLGITLSNNLQGPGLVEHVSVIIPGQKATEPGALVPEFFTDGQGRRRVNSFTHSALPQNTDRYEWNNLRAGTYLIQSGTHPQIQMPMGLYAILKVDQGPNLAYSGIPYQNEVALLYSEIDPLINAAVADGSYGTPPAPTSVNGYSPKYFLINGMPHTAATTAIKAAPPGESLLIRFLNAGLKTHVPVAQGSYLKLIAEDGYLAPFAQQKYSVVLPPGKTFDALIDVTKAGSLPIYDRTLKLGSADGVNDGMYALLDINYVVTLNETAAGAGFDFLATVNDATGSYEYEFWYYDPATGWSQVQAYSNNNSWHWTPPTAGGTYWIAVNARNLANGNILTDVVKHKIIASDISSVALSETPGAAGGFDYIATPTGGSASYEYEFWLHSTATGWTQVQPYSTSNVWNWMPPLTPGTYTIAVNARSQGSSVVAVDVLTHVIAPQPISAVTLAESAGATGGLDYTATPTGGTAPYEYEFWLHSTATGWIQVQAYSGSNVWNWTPPNTPGIYTIAVNARSAGSSVVVVDVLTHVIAPQPITSVALSETPGLGSSFDFTATPTGGSTPHEYEFWLHDPAIGWTQVQAYSISPTWNWTPPATPGTYTIAVNARSQGSSVVVVDVLTHVVEPAPISSVALSETAGAGGSFDVTATPTGGAPPYEYEFWLHHPSTGWTLQQAYSTTATLNWTPTLAGLYTIAVNARVQGSSVVVVDVLTHLAP